jgi:hypothetical protein
MVKNKIDIINILNKYFRINLINKYIYYTIYIYE